MANNEVKIVFTAKTEEAARAVKDAARNIDGLEESSRKASSSIKQTGSSLDKAGASAVSAGKSWGEMAFSINNSIQLLQNASMYVKNVFDMAKEAAQFKEAEESFSRFAQNMGTDSNKIITALKKASDGTISTKNLVATASRALALQVTTDADKLGQLMTIARAKAKVMGTDVTAAFNDIVTGIGRGSPQILDNLGIRIPEGFAEMTKGMDESKKKALLLDTVLKTELETLGDLTEGTESSADKFRKFETSLSDLKMEINESLLPAGEKLVEWLTDVVKWGKDANGAISWLATGKIETPKLDTGVSGQIESLRIQKDDLEMKRNQLQVDRWANSRGLAGVFTFQSTLDRLDEEIADYNNQITEIDKKIANLKENGREIVKNEQEAAKAAKEKNEAKAKEAELEKERKEAEKARKKAEEEAEKKAKELKKLEEERARLADRLINKYANLADNIMPKFSGTEEECYKIALQFAKAAGGIATNFDKAAANAKKIQQELENTEWEKAQKGIYNLNSFVGSSDNQRNAGLFSNLRKWLQVEL